MRDPKLRLISALVVAILVAFASPSWSQTTRSSVFGRVTGSGEPLAGATVTIKGTQFSTSTDADGNYRFLSVLPGRYTIAFSMPGLKTVEMSVDIPAAGLITVNADLEVSSTLESVNITVAVDAGGTENLNVAESTGVIIQSFNGVPSPPITINDADEFAQEAIRETYRRLLAEIIWNFKDNGRTAFWVGGGVFVGSQDLIIERRSGDSITYSGTQVGGYAEVGFRRTSGRNRWEGYGAYFLSDGDATRNPADLFTNATVTAASHSLQTQRYITGLLFSYPVGPLTVSAGSEFFYFDYKRSGTIRADSTATAGLSATIESETRFDRKGLRLVTGLDYRAAENATVTSSFKVGSGNWAGAIGLRWTF